LLNHKANVHFYKFVQNVIS